MTSAWYEELVRKKLYDQLMMTASTFVFDVDNIHHFAVPYINRSGVMFKMLFTAFRYKKTKEIIVTRILSEQKDPVIVNFLHLFKTCNAKSRHDLLNWLDDLGLGSKIWINYNLFV